MRLISVITSNDLKKSVKNAHITLNIIPKTKKKRNKNGERKFLWIMPTILSALKEPIPFCKQGKTLSPLQKPNLLCKRRNILIKTKYC